jgi:hypothetical protein
MAGAACWQWHTSSSPDGASDWVVWPDATALGPLATEGQSVPRCPKRNEVTITTTNSAGSMPMRGAVAEFLMIVNVLVISFGRP